MSERIATRRIFVTYDTAREKRFFINDPTRQDTLELEVELSCTMSVDPKRNRGTVSISQLAQSTRDDLSGIIVSELQYLNDVNGVFGNPAAAGLVNVPGLGLQGTGTKETTIAISGGYCEIDAGLDDTVGRVFEGSVSRVRSRKVGAKWRTFMSIEDGLTTATGAVLNQHFENGTRTFDIVRFVVKSMALGLGNLTFANFQEAVGANVVSKLARGWTSIGNSNTILKQLLRYTGAEWFVDRGEFYLVKKGRPIDPTAAPITLEDGVSGGLRGEPVPIDDGGIILQSEFRNDVRIGRLALVRTRQFQGEWRIDVVDHKIDNRAGTWITTSVLRKEPEL